MLARVPLCFSNFPDNSSIANFKSAAAATRISRSCVRTTDENSTATLPRANILAKYFTRSLANVIGSLQDDSLALMTSEMSYAEDHDFGRFDQRGGALSRLKPEFLRGIGGNDGGNVLLADRQRDLGQQAAKFDGHDAPDQLVSPADLPQIATPSLDVAALQLPREQAIDFAFRDAVVPAGGFYRLEFAAVNPLLQGGVADAQNIRRFSRRQMLLHNRPPVKKQNSAFIIAISIRFNTIRKRQSGQFRRGFPVFRV